MIRLAQQVVTRRAFQGTIIAVIVLAGVLAGVETSAALRAEWSPWLDRLVLTVFVVEIALKITACGRDLRPYFRDGWNLFDCLIVGLCFLPAAGPFAVVLRLSRVLRLVHTLPKLQLLVGALLKSLSAMGYVSLLLGLLFYVYVVSGVHLFRMADPADFGSLPAALLSLFRIVTLDNWGDIFNRTVTHASSFVVVPYFVSFIVLGTMIILNLFIGIIMNSMAEMHKELEAPDAAPASPSLTMALLAVENQVAAVQQQLQTLRHHTQMAAATQEPTQCQNRSTASTTAPPKSHK